MEIKNKTAYTYDILMEFNRQHQKKLITAMQIIICACAGVMILALIAGLTLNATLGGEPVTAVDFTLPLIYVLGAAFLLAYPPIRRKMICTKQANLHTRVECTFTEEGFSEISTSDTVSEQRECKYAIITKVTESEHAFYLYIAPNAAHIIAKNGFTEGTENDFRTLLRTVIEPKKLRIR